MKLIGRPLSSSASTESASRAGPVRESHRFNQQLKGTALQQHESDHSRKQDQHKQTRRIQFDEHYQQARPPSAAGLAGLALLKAAPKSLVRPIIHRERHVHRTVRVYPGGRERQTTQATRPTGIKCDLVDEISARWLDLDSSRLVLDHTLQILIRQTLIRPRLRPWQPAGRYPPHTRPAG